MTPDRAGRPGASGHGPSRRRARRRAPIDAAVAARLKGSMRQVAVHVCVTCRREGEDAAAPRAGARLAAALAEAADGAVRLVPVECLGNCKRSCSVALSAPGSWTYVFGDLTPQSAGDVIAAARLLDTSADGLMPWRGRPEAFKRGMIARIPPLDIAKEAAE